jgi:hypothetical protein
MRKFSSLTLSVIAILFIAFACQRDASDLLPSPPGSQQPDETVITSFQGRVLDENGEPVQGAIATAGGKTAISDNYGIFRIADIRSSGQFAFVTVQKTGYFNGSRTVIANTESVNFVEIQLMPKKLSGTFNSGNPAEISIENNSKVTFQPNSITTKDGAAYSGNVNVHAAIIDPSASNFTSIMPGDLRGIRSDSSVTALISYGMLTVALTGDGGEELQLNKNKPAVISMTIPSSLRGSAPSEIPLWHFDETDGKWKEEGKAIKQGNIYSGEVSHFSTWNYDVPENFVFISLTVGSVKGSVSSYTQVKITDKSNGSTSAVFTDSMGFMRTWVPKNAELDIRIVNRCNEVQFQKTAGPLSADTDLGRVELPSNKMIMISGKVNNCDNQPVQNGYVNVFAKGLFYRGEVVDGEFWALMNDCTADGGTAELYAVDHETNKRGESVNIGLDASDIDAGMLSACGDEQPEQFAYFYLGNERHDLVVVNDSLNFNRWGTTTHFWYTKFPNGNTADTQISIRLTDTVPSTFTNDVLSCVVREDFYYPVEPVTITCTEYGQPGGYIAFNFSGKMSKDSIGPELPFSGAIRAKREF